MAGGNVSEDKVTRMAAWFARHRGDLDSPKAGEYLRGETDRPTPGQIAWLLWGGSLGQDRMAAMEIGETHLVTEPGNAKVLDVATKAPADAPDGVSVSGG